MFRGRGRISGGGGPPDRRGEDRRFDDRRPDKRPREWNDEARPKRSSEALDHRPASPAHTERVVQLLTNAISLKIDGAVFDQLHVYSVKFDGPRPLTFKMDRLKSLLLGHKTLFPKLPTPAFYDYRDELGAKIYVIQMRGASPTVHELMKELADATELIVKARGGGEETWRISFMEERGSPFREISDNPTQFMQFVNHVAREIISTVAGFTLLNKDRRMVKLRSDKPGAERQLRSINGFLVPGYAKNICCTLDGDIIWTFRPQYTLVLNTNMAEYMRELSAELHTSDRDVLSRKLVQKRVTVSTCYAPDNVYRVVTVPSDVTPLDEIEVVQKNARGDLIKKKTSHLEYLQTRYPNDRTLSDRHNDLAKSTMVGVAMIGRQNKGARASRTVFIPAPLLNIVNVPTSSLSTATRVDITKMSQKKAGEAFSDIENVRRELDTPAVNEAFKKYGFQFDPNVVRLVGANNVAKIVNVEVPGGGRLVRLALDDQCSFMRDFTRSDHICPPHIRQWMLVARLDHGQFPQRTAARLMEDLVHTATQKGWVWPYRSFDDGWSMGFEDEADLSEKVDSCLKAFKNGTPRPDVIIGLIPAKDEHDYTCVKRFAFRLGCPSQVITEDLLKRLGTRAFWKVLSGLCGKLLPNKEDGGVYPHPWRLQDSPETDFARIECSNGKPSSSSSTVCLAISTYRQSQQSRGPGGSMGWGIAATSTSDCTGLIQDFGELATADQTLIPRLDKLLAPIIQRLHFTYRRTCENVIVYRRGISEGLLPRIVQTELPAVRKALKDVIGGQDFNSESRVLRVSWPSVLKENGEYEVEVPCKNIESGEAVMHAAKVPLTRLMREDGTKLAALEVTIPESLEVDESESTRLRAPGAKALITMPRRPRVCFVVTNRSNTASLLMFKEGNPRERDGMLTPGGTTLHDQVKCVPRVTKTQDEFYIIPGSGAIGFAAPVHYIIVTNELGLSAKALSDITLKLSFMFYNHQGSNKTPHLLRISESAAEQALTVYRNIEEVVKEDLKKAYGFVSQADVDRLKDSAIFL